jgi:hypothetical protein
MVFSLARHPGFLVVDAAPALGALRGFAETGSLRSLHATH